MGFRHFVYAIWFLAKVTAVKKIFSYDVLLLLQSEKIFIFIAAQL